MRGGQGIRSKMHGLSEQALRKLAYRKGLVGLRIDEACDGSMEGPIIKTGKI
jgi:hypothetical protein